MRSTLHDFTVILKHETDSAWLVNDGSKNAWIPKSQGELVAKSGAWTLTIPEWLAIEKGFA